MTPDQNLARLGLTLPAPRTPQFNYVPWKIAGDMLYLSGQTPVFPDGTGPKGKVGRDVSVEEAYGHARMIGLGLLAAAKAAAGSLDRLEVIKLLGMVNAVPDFGEQPKVINGCSDLLVEVLGERGRHARSAVGFGSLPGGTTVEIEAIMRIHP